MAVLSNNKLSWYQAAPYAAGAVLVGIAVVVSVLAAGAPVAFEAESGTVAGSAGVVSVTGQSGAGAVKFAAASPTPSPGARSCPPLPAHPDANCTGLTPGTVLTTVGDMTVATDGQVIQNLYVTGRLTVTANNVIIRNIKLVNNDYFGVMVYGSNLTISDSTLVGGPNTQAPLAAISGGSWHALRVDVSGGGDGVSLGNDSSLVDSYIHDLDSTPGEHNDDINADGGQRNSIIHNTVLNQNSQTSAMTIGTTTAPSENIVKDNLVAGGGYTIYAGLGAGAGHGIDFENNVFSRRYFPNSGSYGPVAYWQSGNGNVWANNTFEDGSVVSP